MEGNVTTLSTMVAKEALVVIDLKKGVATIPAAHPVDEILAVAGPVVAEDSGHLDRLVARRPPQFAAAWRVAGDLEMAAASGFSRLTIAGFPTDGHSAGPPRVAAATLVGEPWPWGRSLLGHGYIQTYDRSHLNARASRRT